MSALQPVRTRRYRRTVNTGGVRRTNEVALLVIAFALCAGYFVFPSLASSIGLVAVGTVLILLRPEIGVVFLAFGWLSQRQLATYWSGAPLLLLGLLGGLLQLPSGLRSLRRNPALLFFLIVSAVYSGISLLARPLWRDSAINRFIFMAAAIAVYTLCSTPKGRRFYEIAAIGTGVIVSVNAITRAQELGLEILRSGDIADLRLNDSNYASVPIVFGAALVFQRLTSNRFSFKTLPIYIGAIGVMAWGLLMLQSRGGQLAFVTVAGFWLVRLILTRDGSRAIVRQGLAVATILMLVFAGKSILDEDLLMSNRIRWEDSLPSGGSNRVYIYQDALRVIRARPEVILGGGIGRNNDLLQGINAHNQLLDTLLDYGLLGLAALIWLWATFLSHPRQPAGANIPPSDAALMSGVGLAVAAMWLSPIWFAFFWVEIGYLAACASARQSRPQETQRERTIRGRRASL